jgi:hypothetical protein
MKDSRIVATLFVTERAGVALSTAATSADSRL